MTLTPIPALLPAVVRMLASPHDGEVLATVAALKRVLAANDADMNDLADLLQRGVPMAEAPRQEPPRQEQSRSRSWANAAAFGWAEDPVRTELLAMLDLAQAGSLIFTAWEREFIADIADRDELSERQGHFLMKAHGKYLRANQSF